MPKIKLIKDSEDTVSPLRVTRRKARKVGKRPISPSIRVKCGCCNEAIEIAIEDKPTGDCSRDTLEINGVFGTVDQWRQILLPILYANETLVEFPARTSVDFASQMRDVT